MNFVKVFNFVKVLNFLKRYPSSKNLGERDEDSQDEFEYLIDRKPRA